MKDIVVLNGIHTAGKSTIGSELGKRCGFSYYPEIGKVIRQEWEAQTGSLGAPAALSDAFDLEVMTRESDRDAVLLTDPNLPIVETWHTGNMAYLIARNREHMVSEYANRFSDTLQTFRPMIVYVTVSEETFRQRADQYTHFNDMDALFAFYQRVDYATRELCSRYNLHPIYLSNEGDLNESVTLLTRELSERNIVWETHRRSIEY